MNTEKMNGSEFASTLDLSYNKLRSIGMNVKQEAKEIVTVAEWALFNAIRTAKHAIQPAPTPHSLREGSPTQQYLARENAKKIIADLEKIDYADINEESQDHINEAINALLTLVDMTEPQVEAVIEKEPADEEPNEEVTVEGDSTDKVLDEDTPSAPKEEDLSGEPNTEVIE